MVQRPERGIDLPIGLVIPGFVDIHLIGDRFDRGAGVAESVQCRGDISIDAGAQPAQDSGAQGGGFVYIGNGDRPVQDGGFDLHEEPVAGAPADGGDAARRPLAEVGGERLDGV